MPTASEIIDMFANFQKAIGREVGELMGTMIDASTPRGLHATAPTPDMTAFESRIMASIDARLSAFEARLQPVAGRKRSREPSPPNSDVDDTDTEDNEVGSGACAQQCFAPMKNQTTLTRFVQDGKAMADLVGAVKKLEMTEEVAAPEGVEKTEETNQQSDEADEEEETNQRSDEADEEEETNQRSDEADEEEETNQRSDEADEEEELTQITYKGKDYGMDGDGNIYGVDADGDLIEEPIGKMDDKTKRIAFF